jgi:hypothetical protein
VGLVSADVSEERIASIIRVTRIGELGITLGLCSNVFLRSLLRLLVTANFPGPPALVTDDGSEILLRNVGYYKSHVASHHRKRHYSGYILEIVVTGQVSYSGGTGLESLCCFRDFPVSLQKNGGIVSQATAASKSSTRDEFAYSCVVGPPKVKSKRSCCDVFSFEQCNTSFAAHQVSAGT